MSRPLYQEIADDLRRLVGNLPPGHQLPYEQDLAHQHGVHRDTIRDALALLESEGLLDRRRGRGGGTFVRQQPEQIREPVGALGNGTGDSITVTELEAPENVAETLGLGRGQLALRRRRIIHTGKIGEAWYPADLVRETPIARPEPTGKSIRLIFTEDLRLELAPYEEYVSARMPTPDEVAELHLSTGVPVIVTTLTFATADGRVIMTDRTVLAGDKYVLVIPGVA